MNKKIFKNSSEKSSHIFGISWFQQSIQDFGASVFLRSGNFFEHSCFMAHQSTEKALKGFLFYFGFRGLKKHNLLMLVSLTEKVDKGIKEKILKQISILNQFYLFSRYPLFDHGKLLGHETFNTEENATEAIKSAKKIFEELVLFLEESDREKVWEFAKKHINV